MKRELSEAEKRYAELFRNLWGAEAPKIARAAELREQLGSAWETPRRWAIIREYYRLRHDDIMSGRRRNPYELGLERFLTPIEEQVWQDVRCIGLPFFMQYPVGRRFVDFGDPIKSIAIEADGAAYHNETEDAERDRELLALGWRVVRIRGCDTFGAVGTRILRDVAAFYGKFYTDDEEAA